MRDRKQQVVIKAHQLFIEKGFQATSIQDILTSSGISKGTFYNYFPSKSELFKAVFTYIHSIYETERNKLLIGENLADIEIFIKQLDLFMKANKQNKLFSLIEEVFASNEPELKLFIKQTHHRHLEWMFQRFTDIFGEDKRPYLLDCAILFTGMLQQMIQYNLAAKATHFNRIDIIRYCVNRIVHIVEDVSERNEQLLDPDCLVTWKKESQEDTTNTVVELKEVIKKLKTKIVDDQEKYIQILEFIEDDVENSKEPRKYLLESCLQTLMMSTHIRQEKEFLRLQQLIKQLT
ncbi:TetR/AcrR family transcriptional regulator [Metabacillus malikii]|uniref:AcrR family transcriptional regulator n=1 Tax=Metabacillus malikii TaxID=1504265 RepID=A0ABT9ZDL5_9BACI|nr:TetR/AcrR family transcriptional regulator [Metabacillus malikii]MDQ0229911.1 AcrR family transcriptional regulator [Metabacillus malikii]